MTQAKKAKKQVSGKDVAFNIFLYALCILILIIIAYPLYFIIIASFSNPSEVANGNVWFWPSQFTVDGYKELFRHGDIWMGYWNTILYTVIGTLIGLVVNISAAYSLSRKDLVGRKLITFFFIFTMFFNGGMIPTFILINQLHMVNTIWAILLPGAVNVWNLILARTYYQSTPKELREASAIDGANEIQHFFKILMPVCKPIIAVLALYSFVGMWNSYFDAMIYLNDANLQPLQLVLRSILVQNTPQPGMIADIQSTAEMAKVAELLKYATIVVSSLPLLVMYPFFQKYFDSGIMVGSVKG